MITSIGRTVPKDAERLNLGDHVRLEYNTQAKTLNIYTKKEGATEYTLVLMAGKSVTFEDVEADEGKTLGFAVSARCLSGCGIKIIGSSIPKIAQEITFAALADKTYGDANFDAGATASSELAVSYSSDNTNVAIIVDGKIHITGAGTANITVSQAGDGTYAEAPVKTEVLNVNKAPLTITAANKTMLQGAALPTFTAAYNGFVNEDDESVLTVSPVFNTVATSASAPGTYDIEVSGATADNYSISYANGTLTVEAGVLPVNLISFSVVAEANQTKLLWQTASESDNKEYIVSRSTDGVDFVEIAKISGKGNSHTASLYSYYDKEPNNGINYYKLVQADYDGKVSELGIRTLSFSLSTFGLQLYPNPTNNMANLTFEPGKYHTLTIVDQSGKTIHKAKLNPTEGHLSISLVNYPNGIYLLNLIGNTGKATEKVLKK